MTFETTFRSRERGFTLLEMMFVTAITAVIAAVAIPMTGGSLSHFRLSGDARGVTNSIAVAKMRAASHFTQARLFVDLAGKSYRVESWNKTTSTWVISGGIVPLSNAVAFGLGSMSAPPPNTQVTLAQAPLCKANDGTDIGNTACVLFNSRGVPVDSTGAPTAADAIYVIGGTTVYGATVSATGLTRLWRADTSAGAAWVQS